MVDYFLKLGEDGLIHRWGYVYGGCYEDKGLYRPNGKTLALNVVTGDIDVVVSNRWSDTWEKVEIWKPDGKEVGVRKGNGLVEEVELNFFRTAYVKKGDFVPSV